MIKLLLVPGGSCTNRLRFEIRIADAQSQARPADIPSLCVLPLCTEISGRTCAVVSSAKCCQSRAEQSWHVATFLEATAASDRAVRRSLAGVDAQGQPTVSRKGYPSLAAIGCVSRYPPSRWPTSPCGAGSERTDCSASVWSLPSLCLVLHRR